VLVVSQTTTGTLRHTSGHPPGRGSLNQVHLAPVQSHHLTVPSKAEHWSLTPTRFVGNSVVLQLPKCSAVRGAEYHEVEHPWPWVLLHQWGAKDREVLPHSVEILP